MRVLKTKYLTQQQHEFLKMRVIDAHREARTINRAPKPPVNVQAAQRVVDKWLTENERQREKRDEQLRKARDAALQAILFEPQDVAQAAVDKFIALAGD